MTQNLTLVTKKNFGSLACNIYQDDKEEYYMTRKQIGMALGYSNPNDAVQQIHSRNADRLDLLSISIKTVEYEGAREVARSTIAYTLRGVMEICRFSRQPKADAFMDFVWDIMESLYNGNSVLATPDQSSAVAMQTIQSLVDSVLKTQTETTRAMVTMTSTLAALANHLSPAPAPAPQSTAPKNESAPAPAPAAVTPANSKPAAKPASAAPNLNYDDWRNKAYRVMDKIIRNAPEQYTSRRQILNIIYDKMKREYGFVVEQERRNYLNRHVNPGYLSTIQVIEDSTTYREIFESILRDIKNDAIIKHVERSEPKPADDCDIPLSVQRELGMIPADTNISLSHKNDSVAELDAQPVPAPIPETTSNPELTYTSPAPSQLLLDERDFEIDKLIKQAAQLHHDTSHNYSATYRVIYTKMNCDWEYTRQQFYHTYHRQANTNKALICYSYALYQRFVAAVTDYINAAPIAVEAIAREV